MYVPMHEIKEMQPSFMNESLRNHHICNDDRIPGGLFFALLTSKVWKVHRVEQNPTQPFSNTTKNRRLEVSDMILQ